MIANFRVRAARLLGTWLALGMLGSCGGGASAATGSTSGGLGIALGTVDGFGSVVIEQYDCDGAPPHYFNDDSPGAAKAPSAVGLGQRLQLVAAGAGSVALIQPDLLGPVQAVSQADSSFTVNAVRVRVNTDPDDGPVTFYAGLRGFSGLHAGTMVVEVDGAFGIDARGRPYVQATRIEQRPASTRGARLTGRVSELDASRSSFMLGSVRVRLNGATQLYPVGSTLRDGQTVNVWSPRPLADGMLSAGVVRVRSLLGAAGSARLGGLLQVPAAGDDRVAGIAVVPADAAARAQLQALPSGRYVVVQGRVDPTSSHVVANSVRAYAGSAAPISLRGNITGYVDPAHFLVRGVPVDASRASFDGVLGDGAFVQLRASIDPAAPWMVLASTLRVLAGAPDGATVDLQGTVSQYDSALGSFVLSWSDAGVTMASMVALAPNAVFGNGSVSRLADGSQVEIEARQTPQGLRADSLMFRAPAASTSALRTEGIVHDLVGDSFRINGLLIRLGHVTAQGGALVDGAHADVQFVIDPRTGRKLARDITIDQD